jgi:large subunit ribosomal protein L11
MIIKLLVDGGDMKPGPAVGQRLGPLGINLGKVLQEVNAATKSFKGVKVPVELEINKDKSFVVRVLSPPTTELLKKEIGIEKGSGLHKKIKVANAAMEQIISVSKIKYPNLLATNFKAAVKSVVGSCVSLGILIENKEPKEIMRDIEQGKYDKEIEQQKTEVTAEKKKQIASFFNDVKSKQEEAAKKEEAEKAAAEAAPAEGAAAAPGAEEKKEAAPAKAGAKPAAGAKKEAAPAKAGAKPAAGKKEAAPAKAGAKPAAKGKK